MSVPLVMPSSHIYSSMPVVNQHIPRLCPTVAIAVLLHIDLI